MGLPWPPLLVITDRRQARSPLESIAESIFAAGCRWLSVREKDLEPEARLDLLRRLNTLARQWSAVVGVHDDLATARALGVPLHLPAGASVEAARRALGPAQLIGQSFHWGDDLSHTATAGLDYVTLSPVFASDSKPHYGPTLELERLETAATYTAVPVIALGGINPGRVPGCLKAGAAGVAVMGGVMRANDPATVVADLIRYF